MTYCWAAKVSDLVQFFSIFVRNFRIREQYFRIREQYFRISFKGKNPTNLFSCSKTYFHIHVADIRGS